MSKEQKNTLSSNKITFYIVGKKTLQNDLIAEQLYQQSGKECCILNDINAISMHHNHSRFVLWDCQTKDMKEMRAELKAYYAQRKPGNHIVLFNAPTNLKFQTHLFLKKIQGVFYEKDSLKNFLKGIQAVLNGKMWFPREMMNRYILEGSEDEPPANNSMKNLTNREIEILSLIAVGATNQEISKKLYISPNTVKNHLYSSFKKINVSNRIQASLWAAINL